LSFSFRRIITPLIRLDVTLRHGHAIRYDDICRDMVTPLHSYSCLRRHMARAAMQLMNTYARYSYDHAIIGYAAMVY